MSMTSLVVYLFAFLFLWTSKAKDAPRAVRIGGIFDNESINALTAFRHEVHYFNRHFSKEYQIINDTSIVDVTDSFSVINALCQHLSQGDLVIFGVSNAYSLPTIQSYSDTFKVPYVTISMASNQKVKDSFQLYMRPIHTNALVNVMIIYEWQKVTFIYDSDEGLIRLQQLFQAINQYTSLIITIDTKRITTASHGFSELRKMYALDPDGQNRVLLDLPIDKVEEMILEVKNDETINSNRFQFLLGDMGMLEMNLTQFEGRGGANIVGFQLVPQSNQTSEIFLSAWAQLDKDIWPGAGTASINYEAALAADAVRLFKKAFGLIMNKDSGFLQKNRYTIVKPMKCTDDSEVITRHGKKILDKMKTTEFEGLTGHVAFDESGHRKDFNLDLYTVEMNRGPAKIGYWSQKESKIRIQQTKMLRSPNNANENETKIITTIIKEPYVMFKEVPTNGKPIVANEKLEGYCMDLANAVAAKAGFEFKIKFVEDGSYGELLANDSWDGIVGELIRHEAHMAIASFTITAERSRVIDFTKPFMSLGISIMIKRPQPAGKHFFSFMEPLSSEIWMCIVFAYICVSVVLFLVSRFSPNEWHLTDTYQDIANDFSISNSLWFSLGAFMQQGCDISPRSISGRIVGSVWWFFTLIIISSYTANLAAFLTVERMLTPINSAEDLARQTEIQYGTIVSGSTKSFFKNSQYQTYKRMWAYMTSAQPSVFVHKHEDGIEKVRSSNGKYAYLTESTTIEYVSNKKPCDTLKVGNNLNSNGFGIGTPLGSDLRDPLNFAVLELRETGELAKWEKKWFDKGDCPKHNPNKDGGQSALSLANVAGIFYILIGGLITAIISAALEFLYKSKIDSSQSKMSFGCALRSKARLSFKGRVEKGTQGSSQVYRRPHNSVTYTYSRPTSVSDGKHDFEGPDNHTEV